MIMEEQSVVRSDPALHPDETPCPDSVLEVDDLRTYFYTDAGELHAVDGVTFHLPRGKVLALVGESGCGKSVTSYSILQLIRKPGKIVGGRILLKARDGRTCDILALAENSEALRDIRGGRVSMIFQEPMTALSPVHTIGDQICEAILLHQPVTRRAAEATAVEMLTKVGIPGAQGRLKQYPHEMSGGMRQRVVIAMALVCRPELLIADEPTTALDVTIQAQVLRLMKDLQAELGTSILFITHDLGVVAQMADEVAVMYLGRIVEQGAVRNVFHSPMHPYTRELMASLPSTHQRHERLATIKGSVPGLTDIPPGCPFHPRCPAYRHGICDCTGGPPPLEQIHDGHAAACFRVREVNAP